MEKQGCKVECRSHLNASHFKRMFVSLSYRTCGGNGRARTMSINCLEFIRIHEDWSSEGSCSYDGGLDDRGSAWWRVSSYDTGASDCVTSQVTRSPDAKLQLAKETWRAHCRGLREQFRVLPTHGGYSRGASVHHSVQ